MKLLLLMPLLLGCREWSPPKTEEATVLRYIFVPEINTSGSGFSSGGHFVFMSSHESAKLMMNLKCEHGEFVMTTSHNAKTLWTKMDAGTKLLLHYRETIDDGAKDYVTDSWEFIPVASK